MSRHTAFSFLILHFTFCIEKEKRSQGDHGGCGANYRCCIPALAGFVSPHSMGPGKFVRQNSLSQQTLQVITAFS